ncbi:MAG TPA: carboxypeptidase-like regulatory domain-containing protein, partial [Bacteroides sp.]|nr:carboxypeptidase-like regulatory domain-containing protein [Bacteroides sp.]
MAIIFGMTANVHATDLTQTLRGTVIDQDTRETLLGANVILLGTGSHEGTVTGLDGDFRLEGIPVGRIGIKVSYVGYEEKYISNIVLSSGKETVLNIELTESVTKLDEVEVLYKKKKSESGNDMAVISAKSFTVEETKRYAGSINDPARMVSSYAGVTGDAQGNNDIVVRGNSPKGISWRLEGVEIPNPNHFADEGATGGPINALNSKMLTNSDFYSGAFAPEYGNAYSGVFDMRLRNGNNEKREYSFSAGILGTDFTAEGPFKKGNSSSYLINYRYSTLSILDELGV